MILTSHYSGFYQTPCDLKNKNKKPQQQPCHCFIFQCSVSCGRGHKQRNVYCMAKDGSHLESDYCKHLAKPNGLRKCRGGRCPKWKAGAWSQVSDASLLRYDCFPLPSATWPADTSVLAVFLCTVPVLQRGAWGRRGRGHSLCERAC